jgi:hypothetical protein
VDLKNQPIGSAGCCGALSVRGGFSRIGDRTPPRENRYVPQFNPPNAQISSRIGIGTPSSQSNM